MDQGEVLLVEVLAHSKEVVGMVDDEEEVHDVEVEDHGVGDLVDSARKVACLHVVVNDGQYVHGAFLLPQLQFLSDENTHE